MPGSTFRKLVLCGLLTFLAAVPAEAQNKALGGTIVLIGDFSEIQAGTARPMRVEVHGGLGPSNGEVLLVSYIPNAPPEQVSGHIGFSTSISGPFTAMPTVPLSVDANGYGTTPVLYFKAISPVANVYIKACTTLVCATSNNFSVSGTQPPPPPPNQPSASVVASYDRLAVGSIAPLRLQVSGVSGSPGGFVDTYQVTADTPGAMLFSLSPNGPFLSAVSVPIQLNGSGDGQSADFYVKGHTANFGVVNAPQAVSHVVGWASALTPLTPRTMRVVNVNVIFWETYSEDNEEIDDDPMVSGGERIFVGKRTPGDTAAADRRKVRVRAQLSEPIAGVRVRFRWFDADDPTSNNPPIDPNGLAGDDNRGMGAYLSSTTAFTDEDGEVSVVLSVSRQPGDNFRVVASAEAPSSGTNDYLAGLTFSGQGLSNGDTLDTTLAWASRPAVATPLLTVWRRLHIETDTMGMVTGNYVTGTVNGVTPHPDSDGSVLTVNAALLEGGRFRRGRIALEIPGSGLTYSYDVTYNTANKVYTKTPASLVTGWRFKLFDDDDFNENDTLLDGDEGELLPLPDMSLLAASDDPATNKLAAAFIRPTYNFAKGFAPFKPNATPDLCHEYGTDLSELYAFNNQASEADPEYWTIYALSAYQYLLDDDGDPNPIPLDPAVGAVDDLNGKGFALFYEAHADFLRMCALEGLTPPPFNEHADTAVHEVGHLFWGEHGDGGSLDSESAEYSAVTLDRIRSADHP
jgi:hypothetical protein